MTFADWPWRHWRHLRGGETALRLADDNLDWHTLCQQVDRLAAGFAAQGVSEGQGVALRSKNSPQALLSWLALLQCGARVLPLNPQLPDALLSSLLADLSLHFGLALNASPLPDVAPLVYAPADAAVDAAVEWRAERLVSMTLTSGSTGLPKAAVHSAAAHLASAQGVLAMIPLAHHDSWLLSLPLFHVSGQGILWRWLLAGAQLVVRDMHPLDQALAGCTHASLVPTQLWRLLNGSAAHLALKSVLLGGAAIPVALTQAAQARGIHCWCGYGLTELASTVCAKRADGLADVGAPLPGREVRIVDGEIWIKSASLASGYWRQGVLTPLVNEQGWFATRDRGEMRDGRLTVLGRKDNLFFSGGEGIQPEEVERVIAAHPEVRQAFVVPIADAEFGQRPVAIVECADDALLAALPGWLAGRVARFQQPVRWYRLPDSLREGGIKISRRALSLWVAEQK
ncbi:o-succinylbenzoate--CoA ligase [Entomohabitans teleogrylli]|uniref:o-succinylbenzoate--CoA ligase n=1 Tax=Entomohabitans teleogrylli TaxID=1384589 RepID=UPI00073D2CA3|nr:o-succinylbenzoate--CoA ligase [Entomohabitans teleogrylli]